MRPCGKRMELFVHCVRACVRAPTPSALCTPLLTPPAAQLPVLAGRQGGEDTNKEREKLKAGLTGAILTEKPNVKASRRRPGPGR